MKLFKNIFGRLFALYALLLFVITLLIVVIPVWICQLIRDDKRRTKSVLNIYRAWMNCYLPLIFCPVSRKGLGHFKAGENYVVVTNHNSLMDIPVSTPGVPGANKTLAKKEMAGIPLFGMIYRSGSILVDRSSAQSRRRSIEEMKVVLQEGMNLVLYPEGTRNKTSEPLKSFYDGAFSVAIATQKPVLPALIFHTKSILPPDKFFYAWPHRIHIHFLAPVSTAGLNSGDVNGLKQRVFNIMKDYYIENENIQG